MAVIGSYEPASLEDPAPNGTDQATVQDTAQDLGGKALQNRVQNATQAATQEIGQNTNQMLVPDAALEADVDSYTVQTGDYVMKIARRLGVGWLELAQLNNLSSPYVIYSGQELKLPAHEAEPPETVQKPPASTGNQLNFHAYLPMMQRGRVGQLIAVVEKPAGMAILSHAEGIAHADSPVWSWPDLPVDWRQLAWVNSLRVSYLSFRVTW
ncbi:MAG TPA: LysM peptidoglycan-binding domain-containing protein [Anaerolineales bacterium]